MANPNILDASVVQGNNALVAVTTNPTAVVSNAVSSGKIYKVNSIIASNVNGADNVEVTVNVYSEDDLGGTAYAIVSEVVVPVYASVVVLDKASALYLKEDQSIGAVAGGNSDVVLTASWEEIS